MGVNQNEENRDILTHNQVVVGSNPTGPTLPTVPCPVYRELMKVLNWVMAVGSRKMEVCPMLGTSTYCLI